MIEDTEFFPWTFQTKTDCPFFKKSWFSNFEEIEFSSKCWPPLLIERFRIFDAIYNMKKRNEAILTKLSL